MPTPAPKLLVVDDDPDIRDNMVGLLHGWGYEAWGATHAVEALALARQHRPELAITDLVMPDLDGMDLMRLLKDFDPRIEVIFLTGQGNMETAIAALREGQAFDFFQKPLKDLRQLNVAIERALSRRARQGAPAGGEGGPAGPVEPLSQRELEVLALLKLGLEGREMADRLVVSEKTVRNHLSNIYAKLGAKNRTQAVVLAQRAGLL